MVITPNDACGQCGRGFFNDKDQINCCRNCGARFCNDCFKTIKDKQSCECPTCGQPQTAAIQPPQTRGG
jgi:hypothetical protein